MPQKPLSSPIPAAVSLIPTRLTVAPDAWVAPGVVMTGDVTLGRRSSVWFNAVIRGDLAPVVVGDDSNVQDGVIIHVEDDGPVHIGARVTIGHMAVVHGAVVEDDCLIAIGAKVLSGARIGAGSIVGAGALVGEGKQVPPGSLVLGVPGRVVRSVTPAERDRVARNWTVYVQYAAHYKAQG